MKYENISHFEREQKYDMKYEIWRAWAKIWNMKYENMTSMSKNMKYETSTQQCFTVNLLLSLTNWQALVNNK